MLASYPSLPILSDDELVASFGSDQEGIRRYRVLHEILVNNRSQREAAQAVGVSERTVRNVLQLFRREGSIQALRSRASSTRRTNTPRSQLYQPALATALAEEPQAGGDRLLRRARELLGDDADGLSRRTAYRILTQLRSEREREADQSDEVGVVRPALALLIEDPPLSLGATSLAQRLLPDENDALLRGTLMKQALHTAIDKLRPGGEISAVDRDWWPYLICSGEYEAGQSRAELQHDLALSASTYSRAKRQGLEQITATLPHVLADLTETRQSRAIQLLPRTADFIGRRDEQSYYAWRLQTEGMAYLWGLPGSGKTALAAELAAEGRRYGQSIVWHSCDSAANTRPAAVLRSLLVSLLPADGMRDDTNDESANLLDTLRMRLLVRPTVVILDDAHRLDEEEAEPLLNLLHDLAGRRAIRLLLVGQRPPLDLSWAPLAGLYESEARLLWTDLPPLPEAQWKALYAATAGFPQPLRRVAAAYRRAGEFARPEDWREQVYGWADEAIWSNLAHAERALLAVAYGLSSYAWAERYQQLLDELGTDDTLLATLYRRGLIGNNDQRLSVHPVLQLVAEAELREHAELQAICERISSGLPSLEPAAVSDAPSTVADMVQSPGVKLPTGLALLDRLNAALEQSAAYLAREKDQNAQQLAAELELLQAALPGPTWTKR